MMDALLPGQPVWHRQTNLSGAFLTRSEDDNSATILIGPQKTLQVSWGGLVPLNVRQGGPGECVVPVGCTGASAHFNGIPSLYVRLNEDMTAMVAPLGHYLPLESPDVFDVSPICCVHITRFQSAEVSLLLRQNQASQRALTDPPAASSEARSSNSYEDMADEDLAWHVSTGLGARSQPPEGDRYKQSGPLGRYRPRLRKGCAPYHLGVNRGMENILSNDLATPLTFGVAA